MSTMVLMAGHLLLCQLSTRVCPKYLFLNQWLYNRKTSSLWLQVDSLFTAESIVLLNMAEET